jgi:hypothetical protein
MYEYDLNGNYIERNKLTDIIEQTKVFYLEYWYNAYFSIDLNNRIKLYSKSKNKIIKEIFPEEDNYSIILVTMNSQFKTISSVHPLILFIELDQLVVL